MFLSPLSTEPTYVLSNSQAKASFSCDKLDFERSTLIRLPNFSKSFLSCVEYETVILKNLQQKSLKDVNKATDYKYHAQIKCSFLFAKRKPRLKY